MRAGVGRELRARAAVDAHRIQMALAGMLLVGLKVEGRGRRATAQRSRSRTSLRQLLALGPVRRVHRVEMHPPVVLARGTTRACCPAAIPCPPIAHPRIVLDAIENLRRARHRIDHGQPALGVVRRSHRHHREAAIGRQQRRSPSHIALWRRVAACAAGRGVVALGRLRNRDRLADALEPGPDALARLEVENRQPAAILRVADFVAGLNLLGERRFADVSRHLRGTRLRSIGHHEEHELSSPESAASATSAARPARTWAAPARARAPRVAFAVLPPARPNRAAYFFFLGTPLAVGQTRIRARRHVGELHQGSGRHALERDDEQVVVADKRHVGFAARPARAGFLAGGPGDVDAACGRLYRSRRCRRGRCRGCGGSRIPVAVGERCVAPIVVGQPARLAAFPRHHPGGGLVLFRHPPFEVQLLRIA